MSKSFKKKKYNARFPPARIKKIMQTDEDVGKVAAAVPVIISRALEMFIESLVTETSKLTIARNAKTMSTSHIKQTVKNTKQFDFLRDAVKNVPDHQTEDTGNGDVDVNGESSIARRKGRGSKSDRCEGRKKSTGGKKESSDEYEEEDDEETESEEESGSRTSFESVPSASHMDMPAAQVNQTYSLPHPSFPSALGSNNNNSNNNIIPPFQGSTSKGTLLVRDSLISGQDTGHIPVVNFPIVSNSFVHPFVSPLPSQMPPNTGIPMSLPTPWMPSPLSLMPSSLNLIPSPLLNPLSPALLQSQITQSLSHHHPVDLTMASKRNLVAEDDDYDT